MPSGRWKGRRESLSLVSRIGLGNRRYVYKLIAIMLDGLEGPITVNGKTLNHVVPKQDFLSDDDIAKVLSYIRLNFKNNASAIRVREVARMRDKLKDEQDNR